MRRSGAWIRGISISRCGILNLPLRHLDLPLRNLNPPLRDLHPRVSLSAAVRNARAACCRGATFCNWNLASSGVTGAKLRRGSPVRVAADRETPNEAVSHAGPHPLHGPGADRSATESRPNRSPAGL